MRDNHGDKISVHAGAGDVVYLAVTSHFDDELTDAALTPAKARKLARKLRKAADEIDGGAETSSVSAVTGETSSATADGDDFDEHADEAIAVVREASSTTADSPVLVEGDRVRRAGPHYFDDLDDDDFGDTESRLGSVGVVVDDTEPGRIGVRWDEGEVLPYAVSYIARSSMERVEDEPPTAWAPETAYHLPLTQDEAETLAVILAKVGGPTGWDGGPSSPRIHATSVSEKLLDLGVEDGVDLLGTGRFPVVEGLGGVFGGSIYFEATS